MNAIALSIETGSSGEGLIGRLASFAGLRIVDMRPLERLMAEAALATGDGELALIASRRRDMPRFTLPAAELGALVREMVREEVAAGNVLIVGWIAPNVLECGAPALRVCVRAPLAWRGRRIAQLRGYREVMLGLWDIESEASMRARLVERLFGARLADLSNFDLVINAARLGEAECTSEIIANARLPIGRMRLRTSGQPSSHGGIARS